MSRLNPTPYQLGRARARATDGVAPEHPDRAAWAVFHDEFDDADVHTKRRFREGWQDYREETQDG